MLRTYELPNGYFLTTDEHKVQRLMTEMSSLRMGKAGGVYEYEEADGKKVICTFVGTEALNLKFRLADGSDYLAPIIDLGDGSLVTQYLTKMAGEQEKEADDEDLITHRGLLADLLRVAEKVSEEPDTPTE